MYHALMMSLLVLLSGCAYKQGLAEVRYGVAESLDIIHPKRDKARWYIRVQTDTFGERFFFLDTGYGNTTCDDDFIAELSLKTKGTSIIYGESGKTKATKAILPPFTLGGHQIDKVVCTVRDLNGTSSIRDPKEFAIAGVLGMDTLRQFRTHIHPDSAKLLLLNPDQQPSLKKKGVKLGREYGFGLRSTIRVQINEKVRRLILDTGASITLTNGRTLGLSEEMQLTSSAIHGSGNGRTQTTVQRFRIEELGIVGHPHGEGTLYDRRRGPFIPGLLGLNVLGDYRQEYDWQKNWALFERIDGPNIPLYQVNLVPTK